MYVLTTTRRLLDLSPLASGEMPLEFISGSWRTARSLMGWELGEGFSLTDAEAAEICRTGKLSASIEAHISREI